MRSELADLIAFEIGNSASGGLVRPSADGTTPVFESDERIAAAILAAGYRKPYTITTASELDALPDESVVRDFSGDVAEKRAGVWCSYETEPMSNARMAKYLPGIVLHEGGEQ